MARKTLFFPDFVPVAGCEGHWQRHVDVMQRFKKAEAEYDKMFAKVEAEGGTSLCKSWDKFCEAGRVYSKVMQQAFASLDGYVYAAKHIDDRIGVDEKELRSVIIDSLSDKLEELEFSLNVGLLGSKVAQAIQKDTSEESAGDPPFCQDCE